VPAAPPLLEALEHDRTAFAALIGTAVPDGWPEFPESIGFVRDRLAERPEDVDWWMSFFLDAETGALVGSGGFAGPPEDRVVEIGYQIAPAFRGRRLAIGAAAALVEHAARTGRVDAVIAHTLPRPNPSTGVLTALGFQRDGEAVDPDEGTVWRWRLTLPIRGGVEGGGDTVRS
jgi:RimJ/RimL family protein N-acetyltransferase